MLSILGYLTNSCYKLFYPQGKRETFSQRVNPTREPKHTPDPVHTFKKLSMLGLY